jgi:hypothetical protein
VRADALGATSFGLMGVPGWGPQAVRVGTVVALGIAVVAAAGAATVRGWPEGLAELIQRTEDRQAVGPSLEELAGGVAAHYFLAPWTPC